MTTKYYALLTNQGAAKLANATALGTKLQITEMAVGDGGGSLPTPNASQTGLVGEKRRAALNSLSVDANNSSQIIAEQIIPENEGGFWIREIGLFDADGVMIAVANCAETYKPQLQEGSGRTQTVRMIIIVNSTDAVTLKIDPSVVLATRQYVDNGVIEAKQYADKGLADHIAAANPHQQYLQIANALAEVKSAGKVAEVLQNLGLGEGSPVIGSPFPWPHTKMPNELFPSMAGMVFLKSNGASFSGTLYPKLALIYPGLVLPDLRGEFIRGWDDGRGVDSGRELLSSQQHLFASHAHNVPAWDAWDSSVLTPNDKGGDRLLSTDNAVSTSTGTVNGMLNSKYSTTSTGSSETRPRNIAFNYIVRAA